MDLVKLPRNQIYLSFNSRLGFCVDRHDEIQTFTPEPFWSIVPVIEHEGRPLKLSWLRERVFHKEVASFFESSLKSFRTAS